MIDLMKKRSLVTVILVVLMISHAVSAAPSAYDSGPVSGFMYDNFDDNAMDTSIWSLGQEGGPTVAETNQRLEVTLPSDSAGAKFSAAYYSACMLHGDFDIQVDYALLTWPTANGVRVSLSTTPANMERVSFGAQNDFAGGPEVYLADFAGYVPGTIPTSDGFGKLRLSRVGYSISADYFANGGWTSIWSHSAAGNIQDTSFSLAAWSHDPVFADQEVKIAFDNLIINSGELICPATAASDLVITQVADQAKVSTGDPIGFTITVINNGDATANIVTLNNPLPIANELDWTVGGADANACLMSADGTVSCNFQNMAPGAVKTIRLTSPTMYFSGKGFCDVINSTATLMEFNQPVNKTASASVAVQCPLVYNYVSAEFPGYPAGEQISLDIEFGNYGDGIAKDFLAEVTLPTNPGLNWSISSVVPSETASNCHLGDDQFGTYELICSFDQFAGKQAVNVTLTSPTTTASCGFVNSAAFASASNGPWHKIVMKSPSILCPGSDTTAPVITPTVTGTLGANGWYTSNVSLTWSVTDPESAISSTSGCEEVLINQDQTTTDYTCTATSDGGTASQTESIARDASAPIISCPTLPQNPTSGQTVTASVDAAISGLNGAASVLSGTLGSSWPQTLSFTAVDLAGNTATKDCTFNVTYNFSGFMQPVDNPGPGPSYVFNSVKAGGAVPVNFSLAGDKGLNILAAGYPSSIPANCTTANVTDPIEQTVTAGNSSLSYNAVSGTYTYVWKTNKNWAGTCRVLNIKFNDGTQHLAYFQFK